MTDLEAIIAFEQGELSNDEIVVLFQDLVDTGLAWQLQGFYGRTARDLINAGLVSIPEADEPDYDNDDDESIWDDPDMYPGPDPDGEESQ